MNAKQIQAIVTAVLAQMGVAEAPAKTTRKPVSKPVSKPASKPTTVRHARLSKEAFNALKVKGTVPWGTSQAQAREAGLIPTLPVTRKTTKKAPVKVVAKVSKPVKGTKRGFDRALTTMAKLSGMYVADVTAYRHVINNWPAVVVLRKENFTAQEAFDFLLGEARDAGMIVAHKSER